ncbi:hypothetical protein GALL_507120 [mine drainage metagenome]|uniref:Uncharacterized protein n=1 Tax=mine drainage metagenome TaxID=410659 RepID=A0A1J5P803_9ZZZZ
MGLSHLPAAVALVDALEKSLIQGLEAIRLAGRRQTLGGNRGRNIKPQRQIRLAAVLHPLLQLPKHAQVETTSGPLIGKCCIGEAITQHERSALQSRLDHLLQVVTTSGEDQQAFGQRIHRGLELWHGVARNQLTQPPARLTRGTGAVFAGKGVKRARITADRGQQRLSLSLRSG